MKRTLNGTNICFDCKRIEAFIYDETMLANRLDVYQRCHQSFFRLLTKNPSAKKPAMIEGISSIPLCFHYNTRKKSCVLRKRLTSLFWLCFFCRRKVPTFDSCAVQFIKLLGQLFPNAFRLQLVPINPHSSLKIPFTTPLFLGPYWTQLHLICYYQTVAFLGSWGRFLQHPSIQPLNKSFD